MPQTQPIVFRKFPSLTKKEGDFMGIERKLERDLNAIKEIIEINGKRSKKPYGQGIGIKPTMISASRS